MRKTIETTCVLCGTDTVATTDDFTPMCEDCAAWWPTVGIVNAIMRGELVLPREEADIVGEFAVDIPNPNNPVGEWINLGYFDSRGEAIAYVKETLGGDDEGRIGLVSQMPDDQTEEGGGPGIEQG